MAPGPPQSFTRAVRTWIGPFLGMALALLALAPPAIADVDSLYDEYRSAGLIRGCEHGEAELRRGLAEIPSDVRAYDPGFADALNAALEQRAAACTVAAGVLPVPPAGDAGGSPAADGSPGPQPARPPAGTAATDEAEAAGGGPQSLLLALTVLAALLAALVLVPVRGILDRAGDLLFVIRARLRS